MVEDREHLRLRKIREQNVAWKKWGPYLSERQWETVYEDYGESALGRTDEHVLPPDRSIHRSRLRAEGLRDVKFGIMHRSGGLGVYFLKF